MNALNGSIKLSYKRWERFIWTRYDWSQPFTATGA